MKVMVINAGSSSLKYQVMDMDNEMVLAKGVCERIGESGVITHKLPDGQKFINELDMPTHKEAFDAVVDALTNGDGKIIDSLSEISAVGHRVVLGGSKYTESTLITQEVIDTVESLCDLAPLHNSANILGIKACQATFGCDVPQVAVFDTSFHQTMPEEAYMYAIPYEFYEKYGIRKYGYHGTSHRYVSDVCAQVMNKDKKDIKIITCHLGNGCSISAIKNGKCIDTSMGLTPLDGVVMGTRCGSIDPSIVTYLMQKENLDAAQIDSIMNKKSGLLGVSGLSNDSRDVNDAAVNGNERCKLAVKMQHYHIVKLIGAYAAAMNGVDAIVFAGGIGENNPYLRQDIMSRLTYLGVEADQQANSVPHCSDNIKISSENSKVSVFVIPTDEELAIARDTLKIVSSL
ncbi:MAG: acetate kinase [bacterium]|nr:acetate kinase [bacterium]